MVELPEAVIVLHEVWGYNGFIEEVCRRLSLAGLSPFAPKLYLGHEELFTPARIRGAMKVVWNLPLEDRHVPEVLGRLLDLKDPPEKTRLLLETLYDPSFRDRIHADVLSLTRRVARNHRRIGVVGFSLGGGFAYRLASDFMGLSACVAYSTEVPPENVFRKIRSPVLALYGCEDDFTTRRLGDMVEWSIKYRKGLTLRSYPQAGHEFFDWTNREGFSKEAATDAWAASLEFLSKNGHRGIEDK